MSEVSLTGWMKALIAYVRSGEPDLTNRQMALLMLVYLTPGPHTVRGLARILGVSKPVVTRALNTLGALGYLRRERDQDDRPGRCRPGDGLSGRAASDAVARGASRHACVLVHRDYSASSNRASPECVVPVRLHPAAR